MNKTGVIIITAAIVALMAFFLLRGREDAPTLKDGPIVAFGDSLISGYGSTEGRDLVSRLSGLVGEEIVNLGVSGDTTVRALERINSVIDLEPRVTIVLLGGNDFLRKVPREETFSNLRNIILTLQASGSRVILLGVRGGLLIDTADSDFEDLADETGAAYVPDVLDGLFADSRYMYDSIHPNDIGYERIADRVYPELLKIIR